MIDKHIQRLLEVADRFFFVVEKGRTVWSGAPSRVRAEEAVVKAYLSV